MKKLFIILILILPLTLRAQNNYADSVKKYHDLAVYYDRKDYTVKSDSCFDIEVLFKFKIEAIDQKTRIRKDSAALAKQKVFLERKYHIKLQ